MVTFGPMIGFQRYIPVTIPQLVKSIWYMELAGENAAYEEEIVPDGHHELILYLTEARSRRRNGAGIWEEQPRALIAGQTLQSYRLRMAAGSKLYGIRFYPHSLYPLLGVPLHLLSSAVLPLDHLLKGRGLEACVDEDVAASFRRLEDCLAGLFREECRDLPGYGYVEYSVSQMLASHGGASIKGLVKKSGITAKHYDELFKKYVGLPPKCLCSIVQFNHFIHYKSSHPGKTLTECAYEAGYYDQSHLIKAFNQWVGVTPGQYFHSQSAISDLFAGL